MEIPHEDQSSHYDHEKDKFAYLSMRDRIELGKRQVQQSQWGSKYVLNEDISMKAKLASMARRIEEFELRNVHTEAQPQDMPTSFEYINHPNLATQPQPQPSMSTSSLEQAILKISKVMEDFVGEQQKINSHLNEKIDNMESSINVRMEGVYNDLSLRIEKVQDSIEKLTNLDIARGKRKLPPQPHHNLQGTNAKRSRKVLMIDTLVGDCYDNSMDQPSIENHKVQDDKGLLEPFKASTSPGKRREMNSHGLNGKDANFVWDPGGIQHEVGVPIAPSAKIFAAAKPPLGTRVPFRSTVPSFRSCEMAAKSPKREISNFRSQSPISQGVSQLRNHPLAHECHFAAPYTHFAASKWLRNPPCLKILQRTHPEAAPLLDTFRSTS
ncbi:hypothetical protein CK203_051846 [Vitis vinifera]|uniref:Uncharacterized protein n=1 Tax=Vitis vinifera TaxID=29760 RepID=A0A438GUQ1_VITVI|nr:hypothetical protein CK203_051846 [Vitis vinifera]